MLLFLRVQMCLLSSVDFLCFACWNDAVWFLYLALKSSSVSPMYVSVVLLSLLVTVAWYSPRLKFPVFFFFFLFFFFSAYVFNRFRSKQPQQQQQNGN